MSGVDPLRLRRTFGRVEWLPPQEYGPQGWRLDRRDQQSSVLVSWSNHPDPAWEGVEYVHASIAHVDHLPTYAELQQLHRAVWGRTGYAYQAFVPLDKHVNHHPYALHLWGRTDGRPCLPDFSALVNGQRMV